MLDYITWGKIVYMYIVMNGKDLQYTVSWNEGEERVIWVWLWRAEQLYAPAWTEASAEDIVKFDDKELILKWLDDIIWSPSLPV